MKNFFLYLISVLVLGTLFIILGGFITTITMTICYGVFACLLTPIFLND